MNKFQMPAIEVLMFDEEEVVLDGSMTPQGFTIGTKDVSAGRIDFDDYRVNLVKPTGSD